MRKSNGSPRGFRLWDANRKRLDYAKKLGLNASEVVNEVLSENLRPYLEKRREKQASELREVLSTPVP